MTQNNTNTKTSRGRRLGALGGVAALAITAGTALFAAPANAATSNVWDQLANCESSGNWSINTGNGYYGGLQFSASTWKAYGGTGLASNASKAEQIRIAQKVQASQGWGAWPACAAKLGLYGQSASAGATSAGTNTSGSSSSSSAASSSTSTSKSSTSTAKSSTSTKSTATSTKSSTSAKSTSSSASSTARSTSSYTLPTNVKSSGKTYTVKSGDTLSKIAKAQGVDSWLSLYSLNKSDISDPNLIYVGATLEIPAS